MIMPLTDVLARRSQRWQLDNSTVVRLGWGFKPGLVPGGFVVSGVRLELQLA
jgi:hypothetical protein